MNKAQALDLAYAMVIPEFLFADGEAAVNSERIKTEEAINVLIGAYFTEDKPDFDFDCVMDLADRNRAFCDQLPPHLLGRGNSSNIKRALSLEDTIRSIAALQHRPVASLTSEVANNKDNVAAAFVSAAVGGSVIGIDIETTGISPDRCHIVNVGWETCELSAQAEPYDPHTEFCGLPDLYATCGVPLEHIHHISWDMISDKVSFRDNKKLQKELLEVLKSHPFMAHNAAFEDSWFMLNIDGYAQARKAGEIIPIDTREICRRLDPDVSRLPRESSPASLESWARRRHTLAADEAEYHQGLEDVDLMLKTTLAEFQMRNMY